MRRLLAVLGLAVTLVTSPLAYSEQCPCPPKKVRKAVKRKPKPAPTPTPTPAPEFNERAMPLATDDNVVPINDNVDPRWMQPIEAPAPAPTPTPTPAPEGMKATVLAGGLVSFGSGTEGGQMAPLARIGVNGPVPLPGIQASHFPRILVSVDFTALPGESAQLSALESFKALEFQLAVAQRVAPEMLVGDQRISASLYALAGFATRLPGDLEPRDQSPRYGALGFRLDEWTSGSFVAVAIAADQRLDGLYQPTILISGAVLLKEASSGTLKGGRAFLVGSAILGLNPSYGASSPARRDVVRVGVAIGR